MKTGIITTDTYQNHNTGDGHPEQIARVSVILENFKKINNKNLIWKKPSKVNNKILKTTHDSDYIDFVQNSFPKKGLSFLDGDTIISPGSKEATMDAVGSIITAIDGASRAAEVAIAGLLSELKIIKNEKIKKIKKIPIKNSANQIIGSMRWIC